MDYSKSGSAAAAKTTPRPKRMNTKGAPAAKDDGKEALLARMKAAAAEAKAKAPKTE